MGYVPSYTTIEINPQGIAEIWLKHDQNHLFIVIQFIANSDNPRIALQLDNTNCMTSNTDAPYLAMIQWPLMNIRTYILVD